MGTWLKVGEEFDMFREKHGSFVDGSYFEALDENAGFIMATYLGDMTQVEKELMSSERIYVRMIKDDNKILFITRYGEFSPLAFEVTFDPTLYKDERAMQIVFDNHMVSFVGVERKDNTIQTLRQANFPMKLKQALITAWTSAYAEEDYSKNYRKWVDNLCQYNILTLWSIGEDVGYFGEKGVFE